MRNVVLVAVLALGVTSCEVVGFAAGVSAALIEGEHYSVEQGEVRWISYTSGFTTVSRRIQTLDADAESFEIAEDPIYGTDRHHVFCKAAVLESADPGLFRVLKNGREEGRSVATDGRYVWRYCDRIEGADGASFQQIGGDYGADHAGVWLGSSRIGGADPASFRVLDVKEELAVDARAAYAGIFPIPTDQPGTIRPLGAGYSTDGVRVYWRHYPLEGADPGTFEVRRGERFGRDRSGCWPLREPRPCLNP